jgi:hypothetical protein
MRTHAHEYFEIHVTPNLDAWMNQLTDMRLAMNAVVVLYHMADHFWHAYSSNDPSRVFHTDNSGLFRLELAKRGNQYKILRDVAEAHKHMELDRSSRVLTQANQTAVGATGWGEGGFDTGPFGGGPSIVIELDDGSKHHLSSLAQKVSELWASKLT